MENAVKAASHPIRNQILRNLKKGPLSTIDLEEMVGENRYNLYHHLEVLIRSNLICEDVSSGKMKKYRMNMPKKPEVGVLLFNQDDIKNNLSSWYKILDILEKIEGEKIPIKKKINKYAFSGGQPDIDEHRKIGGNPDIDVSYQYLRIFFEPDDDKLKKIYDDYKSGKMLTGELKSILIEKINEFLSVHQQKREEARKNIDDYLLRD